MGPERLKLEKGGPVLAAISPLGSRRLSCAADGRDYLDRRARTTQRAERLSLRGEREPGDDSLPTLGQAWLRE